MLPRGKFSCVGLLLLGECHGLLLSHRGADRKTRFSPAPNVDKHEQTEVALGWFETEADVLALSGLDLEGVRFQGDEVGLVGEDAVRPRHTTRVEVGHPLAGAFAARTN